MLKSLRPWPFTPSVWHATWGGMRPWTCYRSVLGKHTVPSPFSPKANQNTVWWSSLLHTNPLLRDSLSPPGLSSSGLRRRRTPRLTLTGQLTRSYFRRTVGMILRVSVTVNHWHYIRFHDVTVDPTKRVHCLPNNKPSIIRNIKGQDPYWHIKSKRVLEGTKDILMN